LCYFLAWEEDEVEAVFVLQELGDGTWEKGLLPFSDDDLFYVLHYK
jgi:hypothetical protein